MPLSEAGGGGLEKVLDYETTHMLFTEGKVRVLRAFFEGTSVRPDREEMEGLAVQCDLSLQQVQNWFRKERQRRKRKRGTLPGDVLR